MTKKRLSNLIVLLLCVVLLPISLNMAKAKASSEVDAYYGVEFSFEVPEEQEDILDAGKNVKITVQKQGDETVVVLYEKTVKTLEGELANTYFFTSYKNGKVTARITKAGTYNFVVKTIVGEGETAVEYAKTVEVHSDVNELEGAKYAVINESDEKYLSYQAKATNASYVDAEASEKVSLYLDDDYVVPSVEELLDLGSFVYSQYKRTVYYATPGSTSYVSSSASGTSDLTFDLTKVGTYRFYVLVTMDKIDGKSFDITIKGLQEYDKGFYSLKRKDNSKTVYVSGTKYYEDVAFTTEIEGLTEEGVEKDKLIVPIFEFTIQNAGPNLSMESSTPENGYVGLEYEVPEIKVSGSEVDVTYKLQYKATESDTWGDATEELDESSLTFTPEKEGFYRVVATAIDSEGKDAVLYTDEAVGVISVSKKYQPVEYKTSFGDWLSVNYVPFIFLCISAACLIAIILLLIIKPKEEANKTKVEEDK